MLAKFDNEVLLEVIVGKDINGFHVYNYTVFDLDGILDYGWTEYRSMEMYYPMNEIDYILEFCEPDYVKGKYELLKYETIEEYEKYLEYLSEGYLDDEKIYQLIKGEM